MTKLELAEQNVYLQNYPGQYDFAVPQQWADYLCAEYQIPYTAIISNFVWLYDESASIFGRPYPLNIAGWVVCKIGGIEWTLKNGV